MIEFVMNTDGGSRGNPGLAGCGYVIKSGSRVLCAKGFYLGHKTNNEAEYEGLLQGLKELHSLNAKNVKIYSDSELLVKQINGAYKVKSPKLIEIYLECLELLAGFNSWQVLHTYRENNAAADQLANKAMDKKVDVTVKFSNNASNTKKLRLGVLVSGGGRTMENIQKQIDLGLINAEISLVICSREQIKGVQLAQRMGFKTEIIRRKDFESLECFSDQIAQSLRAEKVDLVIQAGWLCLWTIPDDLTNKVMNIHPALLPSFGGQGMWGHNVHEAVIKRGCKISGCTVHFCNNEYDKGPIIVQRSCEVLDTDDADTLAARVFQQECIAYPEAISLFCKGKLKVDGQIVRLLK